MPEQLSLTLDRQRFFVFSNAALIRLEQSGIDLKQLGAGRSFSDICALLLGTAVDSPDWKSLEDVADSIGDKFSEASAFVTDNLCRIPLMRGRKSEAELTAS